MTGGVIVEGTVRQSALDAECGCSGEGGRSWRGGGCGVGAALRVLKRGSNSAGARDEVKGGEESGIVKGWG